MLSNKIEKLIFVCLFFVILIAITKPITIIKQDYLPINVSFTPDQVIQSNFHVKNYTYAKYGDYLFAFFDRGNGIAGLDMAKKGIYSGYQFKIYGIQNTFDRRSNVEFINIDTKTASTLILTHKKTTTYIFEFLVDKKGNFKLYDSCGNTFNVLTLSSAKNVAIVNVINNLPNDYKIFSIDDKQKYEVINAVKIKKMVG
jgi:hypothetical protein